MELALKAALVVHNRSIYGNDPGRTLSNSEAIKSLGRAWDADHLPHSARAELLFEERNTIQHRYGAVDEATTDFHMESASTCSRKSYSGTSTPTYMT